MNFLHIVLEMGVGGASWAFAAEVPTKLIQLYGDCAVTLIRNI
jgi:hypothetical protein